MAKISKTKSSVDIVDGKLVLSCPNALKPIVWQMDLASVKASALEVNSDNTKSEHSVMLKATNGDAVTIVTFSSEKDALDTLLKTAKAMKDAHGKISNSNVALTPAKKGGFLKTLGVFLLGSLLTIAILLSISFMGRQSLVNTASNTNITSAPAPIQSQNGVPLSADEFLRRR